MRYIDFRNLFKEYAVFSISDIRRLAPQLDFRRLHEWQGKNYIRNVVRGYYVFSDKITDASGRYEIANRIYAPSYVSCESALAQYNFIPETVYAVTSVSTRKTSLFHTADGDYSYRALKASVFFGYTVIYLYGRPVRMAAPEKAVLDYLYLNPYLNTPADIESVRLNTAAFTAAVKRSTFENFIERFACAALARRARLFMKVMGYD
jgi:predicted transcriptional regulator of viral defense system